jgi:glycosyltransferase involved in cell wall biosynthesis/GT2 family glycosyltransferase
MNSENLKIVWVHNFPTHYTVRLFQLVHDRLGAKFLFFSPGQERFWLQANGVSACSFPHENLPGATIFGTRFVWTLPWRLWRMKYDALVQCVDGRFVLPVAYAIARVRGKPVVLYTGIWMRIATLPHRLAFPMLRYIYRHADAVIVYGEHVKRYLITEGVPAGRIFVETHAVDNSLYNRVIAEEEIQELRRFLDCSGDQKLILYLGRIEIEKGLDDLLHAVSKLENADAILILAGTGSQTRALERLARELGIAHRIRLPGYVPLAQTSLYYAAAWVFVLPSITTRRDKETWGLVVNEAFNQGLPVIATDAVGAAAGGLIEDGVNGWIVPERDARSLANALTTMLADGGLRNRMGAAARQKIATWNQERAAEAIEGAIGFVVHGAREEALAEARAIDPASLAVVIPVHNRAAFTRACLDALRRQSVRGFQIIVIDDGSTDGTEGLIRQEFPEVMLISGDGGLWWSKATNLGIAAALKQGAEFILTLNDDTLPAADFIEHILRSAALRPGALIGACAIDASTDQQVFGGEQVHWPTAAHRSLRSSKDLVEVSHSPGRGLLIPAATFERVGWFDAIHFPQGTADYDFTHRARRAGARIYCDRSVVLKMYPAASGDASFRAHKSWRNYYRHLFDIKGGGNLRVFFWYAARNCPKPWLPLCLAAGLARRIGGYPLEWLKETFSARRSWGS